MARATSPERVVKLLDRVWPGHPVEKGGQEHMVVCPFCETTKNKCAVNPDKGVFQCWVCEERGPVGKLLEHLRKLKVVSSNDIKAVSTKSKYKLSDTITSLIKPKTKAPEQRWSRTTPCVLPDNAYIIDGFKAYSSVEANLHKRVVSYLHCRGLSDDDIQKYRLHFVNNFGNVYHGHIVIPALGKFGRELTYWTTRSIFKDADPKSLHAGKKYSRFSAKTVLFNEHLVVDTVVALCEGPFDAWSIIKHVGIPACPLLGKQLHRFQLDRFVEKGVKEAYVCLDPDAVKYQARIGRALVSRGIIPRLVTLKGGDPNDVPPKKLYAAFKRAAYKKDDPLTDFCNDL